MFTIHSAAIGAKITGVDETTFTRTGKAFSSVIMPKETSHNHRVLQKDDVEVGTSDLLCLELSVFLPLAFAIEFIQILDTLPVLLCCCVHHAAYDFASRYPVRFHRHPNP